MDTSGSSTINPLPLDSAGVATTENEVVSGSENNTDVPHHPEEVSDNASSDSAAVFTASSDMTFTDGLWHCKRGDDDLVFDIGTQSWMPLEEMEKNNAEKEALVAAESQMKEGEDEFSYQLRLEGIQRNSTHQPDTSATTFTDPNDGTVYEWSVEKRAWLPKVDEDFIALYQASYGLNPLDTTALEKEVEASTSAALQEAVDPKELKKQKRRDLRKALAEQDKRGWFELDESHNKNVYVSGLPSDITAEEFEAVMSKCGIIEKELDTGKLKLKLYQEENGQMKGDGRCCYIKKESVELALQILDGYQIRPGVTITVERAQFSLRGQYDPSKRKKTNAKLKKKMKLKQEKLLDWRPDKLKGERPKSDATVVIKNLFDLKEMLLTHELQELLKSELSKYGVIKKVVVYENNPEGVALVTFAEPEMADDCITMTDHRVLRGRTVRADRWDGKTHYKIEETEEERMRRIASWEKQLDAAE